MEAGRILLVDDDPFVLAGLGQDLTDDGYRVTTARCAENAIGSLRAQRFDAVITDLVMDGQDGIDVLKAVKARDPQTIVIILTGYGELTYAIEALRHRADDFLLKPCEPQELRCRLKHWLDQSRASENHPCQSMLLPVCCVCHKVRDDAEAPAGRGPWMSLETYLYRRAGCRFTSTYCPECARKVRKMYGLS